jgi:hypothetical protein
MAVGEATTAAAAWLAIAGLSMRYAQLSATVAIAASNT